MTSLSRLKPARRTFTAIKIAERPREGKGGRSALHDADGRNLGHEAADPQFMGDPDHLVDVLISGGGFLFDIAKSSSLFHQIGDRLAIQSVYSCLAARKPKRFKSDIESMGKHIFKAGTATGIRTPV